MTFFERSHFSELDRTVFLWANGLRNPALDFFLGWPTYFGSLYVIGPLLFFGLLFFKRKQVFRYFALIFVPLLLNHSLIEFLKAYYERPRPYHFFAALYPPQTVNVLFDLPGNLSFPSGHASSSFLTAMLLVVFFGKRLRPFYALAALVAFSRMYIGVHYPSDLIGGIAVAFLTGFLTFLIYRKYRFILN